MHFQARRHYSQAFRRQAAEHSLASRETVAEVAAKLGLHPDVLTRWRRELIMNQTVPPDSPKPRSSDKTPQQLEREITRLEKKLRRVEGENAILKKASEYFTKNPR